VDLDQPVIVRGFEQDEISDKAWENIEAGEPPKWVVMKEVIVRMCANRQKRMILHR